MAPSLSRPLRLGTRGSPLALAQADLVARALREVHGWGAEMIEIVPITTTGDVVQDRPLAEIGGKALWTKELDRCLADGRTDASVHSMKDVETIRPDDFTIAAYLPREDTADRLIGAADLDALPQGAVVGTSSPRRRAQLLSRRPDLKVVPIRGNVQTRIAKVGTEVDATLLAAAGLNRLGMEDVGVPITQLLPAPAQGAIGVEVRSEDHNVRQLVGAVDHAPSRECVEAERAFLMAIGGNCHSAVAARASTLDGALEMRAEILSPDGSEKHEAHRSLSGEDSPSPGDVARELLCRASDQLRELFAA
jgi:hydroxymethylbilane synthase